MFAGPNGSGKSELITRLQESDLPLGPVRPSRLQTQRSQKLL